MNLLGNGQETDLQKRIISTVFKIDISEDEKNIAREFFDLSKEIDLSLLNNISSRSSNYPLGMGECRTLFDELLRLPKEKSLNITDRYILFLDAVAGNTIGKFIVSHSYAFDIEQRMNRVRHAYEIKYKPEEINAKTLAFLSYEADRASVFYTQQLISDAKKDPYEMYKAGKYYCCEDDSFSKSRLYSLAIAYRKDDSFTKAELDEMENHILEKEKKTTTNSISEVEKIVVTLFMSKSYGSEISNRFQLRMKQKFNELLPSILQYIPADYFEKNMELVAQTGKIAVNMPISQMIERTVQSAVVSYAFEVPESCNQTINSLCFLNLLAKNYTKDYIAVIGSNKKIGVNSKFGKYSDFYNELAQILEKAVPDVKEKYGLDTKKEMVDMAVHREVMDVKITVKKQVMNYLNGNADISIFDSVKDEIRANNKPWSDMKQELNVLSQLKNVPDFYSRYVAYKFIQNPELFKHYFTRLFNSRTEPTDDLKLVFRSAKNENIPLESRIKVFEMIYSYNDYFENRVQTLQNFAVDIMAENSDESDEAYKSECPAHEVITRCCFAKYLEKTNTDNKNKDNLIALCADSSKEVRRTVVEIMGKHKEYETEVIEMLSAKKQTVRETAVDILSVWGAGKYSEILEKAAENEKSAKLADKIRAVLGLSVNADENNSFSPMTFVDDMHKGGRNRKILWLFETSLPEVHFKNGTPADERYLQALILCYSTMPTPGRNGNAFLLANELDEAELNKFAMEIFSRWYKAGADSKTKWAMYFSIIHGGDVMVENALKCIKDWAENMRGAIAAEAVKAISLNGSTFALMTVDNLAHKFKQKQVKKAAAESMETAAEALGITADELADRIVPDLGFDENMERVFDYGTRKFKVYLSPRLDLDVFDENGKKIKSLPAPGKKDDEVIAKQSNAEYKALKKQIKNVISIQKMRLDTALLADRRWKKDAWEKLFVKNPVMHSFAIGLIWAAYDDEGVHTFRYMEDGTFNTVDEEEYELPAECRIGLVHPVDWDEELISAWKEQLEDYEIIQPIVQLEKPVYRIKDDEIGNFDLERFRGRTVNALTLLGRMTKFGWNKGSTQDAGVFYTFYREDVTERIRQSDGSFTVSGNAVEMHFSGTYVAVENDDVDIENVRFYHPGTIEHGSYVYDEADDKKAITLDKIPPRYFSEIVLQLEEITK